MILIFSIDNDYSTSCVINWLIKLRKPFIRINEDSEVQLISLEDEKFVIVINGTKISSDKITKMWYRRGGANFLADFKNEFLKNYLSAENATLMQYFNYLLDKIPSINKFYNSDVNKLQLLNLCKKNDILTPNFIVTSCRSALIDFYNREYAIISKPLTVPFSLVDAEDFAHHAYTAEIELEDINKLPEKFVATFFQRKIVKDYEVRVFYLNGKFYSMAIFSQNNRNTSVDFRNYDDAKPNRLNPYKLPNSYQDKIKKLLDIIGLNCASFDVVRSKEDNQYYFLDLNPIGQFGMVSTPCNYNLEKEIALAL